MIPKIEQVLDLTQPLYHNCPSLATPLPPQVTLIRNASEHGWTLEQLTMTTHQGTHMDAPYHLEGYSRPIDKIGPDMLHGVGVIVDLRHKRPLDSIVPADMEPYSSQIGPDVIVCLCTGWGEKRAWTREWALKSPWLSPLGATWLVERRVRGVGIDHFSIGGMVDDNEETHRILLGADIWVLEDMKFPEELFSGEEWHIFALPIRLQGGSGAPCRVIAVSYCRNN